jgi:hypothetical protein
MEVNGMPSNTIDDLFEKNLFNELSELESMGEELQNLSEELVLKRDVEALKKKILDDEAKKLKLFQERSAKELSDLKQHMQTLSQTHLAELTKLKAQITHLQKEVDRLTKEKSALEQALNNKVIFTVLIDSNPQHQTSASTSMDKIISNTAAMNISESSSDTSAAVQLPPNKSDLEHIVIIFLELLKQLENVSTYNGCIHLSRKIRDANAVLLLTLTCTSFFFC